MTSNLRKRVWEHKNKLVTGSSEKYNLTKLVYFEHYQDMREAIFAIEATQGRIETFRDRTR